MKKCKFPEKIMGGYDKVMYIRAKSLLQGIKDVGLNLKCCGPNNKTFSTKLSTQETANG